MYPFYLKLKPKSSGFTLIEILITVIIIGLLSGVAVYKLSSSKDDADLAYLKQVATSLNSDIQKAIATNGVFPSVSGSTGLERVFDIIDILDTMGFRTSNPNEMKTNLTRIANSPISSKYSIDTIPATTTIDSGRFLEVILQPLISTLNEGWNLGDASLGMQRAYENITYHDLMMFDGWWFASEDSSNWTQVSLGEWPDLTVRYYVRPALDGSYPDLSNITGMTTPEAEQSYNDDGYAYFNGGFVDFEVISLNGGPQQIIEMLSDLIVNNPDSFNESYPGGPNHNKANALTQSWIGLQQLNQSHPGTINFDFLDEATSLQILHALGDTTPDQSSIYNALQTRLVIDYGYNIMDIPQSEIQNNLETYLNVMNVTPRDILVNGVPDFIN